ncbi:substrate-binding domain-containing protein [Xanthobacteraceae bacterium Astr-EGSB]|uniref:LacI family DNA-binding transcriptional regulator n=1 Tax=Astrobacterium formosum TaxID=3069710 RepID=UPI0027AF2FE1|nr:substrate-binding domain-containing protein [Xanthobacteraceae bacterium Astr-EGSB]
MTHARNLDRPTIGTVARQARCSPATVSRVINASGPVSADARARVERAVAELRFRPDVHGQSLRSRRYRAIGVVVPSYTNPVFANSLAGIESTARDAARMVFTAATDYAPERELAIVEGLLAQRPEGLLLTVADADRCEALDRLDRARVPYVLVHNHPADSRRHAVAVDNFGASRDITAALIAAGHCRFAYVSGSFRTTDRGRRRFDGCVAALAQAGLPPPALAELDYMGSPQDHRRDLTALLGGGETPTALVCSNDHLALSVAAAVRTLGFSVPDDISIAGFDGIAIARLMTPSLATVETPTQAMGAAAMQRLLRLIDGERPAATVELFPYQLRSGGTCSAAPSDQTGGERRRATTT